MISRAFQVPKLGKLVSNRIVRGFSHSVRAKINFDPYKTLGLLKEASQADIKKAYYQLVKKFHPDVNKEKDAEKNFHKIQESYELLSDKEKRSQYDQFGPAAFDQNGQSNTYGGENPFGTSNGNPFGGANGNPFSGMGFDFEDLFKQAFNNGSQRGGRSGRTSFVTEHVGDNVEILKTVSFKDAIFGTSITINYRAIDSCLTCQGSGLKKGKKKSTCSSCHGTGQVTHVLGGFQMASTCSSCNGSGVRINHNDECGTCHGSGVQEVPKTSTVDLPCGIADGSRLRIPGGGDAPLVAKDKYTETRNGDLIVRVHVEKDNKFERVKNNLQTQSDILMTTAALGGEIVVPTLDGPSVKLKIRPGTQSGTKLSIPEKGVPVNRNMNNRGDLEVILNVKTAAPRTPIETALLEALADSFEDGNAKRSPANSRVEDILVDDKTEGATDKSKLRGLGKLLGKLFGDEGKKAS